MKGETEGEPERSNNTRILALVNKMYKVKAKITLFSGIGKRQTPFISGYRPLFSIPGMPYRVSGSIHLMDRDQMTPGETAEVEIIFFDHENLFDLLEENPVFTFSEGFEELGEGKVVKVFREL